MGLAGGLNLYVYCEGNPITYIDPLGLCPQGNGDEKLQQLRTFIEAANKAADDSIFPKGLVLTAGAIALHGGGWTPLNVKATEKETVWIVDGQVMLSDEFGNYLAGYYAGYNNNLGLYWGMRAGGIFYAAGGNIAAPLINFFKGTNDKPENWLDHDSVPAINAGFNAGVKDFINAGNLFK